MTNITTEEKNKIEMSIQDWVKECNENGWHYDQKSLQRMRNAQTQCVIHNQFCDENYTFNCVQMNPKNVDGIKDKSFALIDISTIRDELLRLEDDVVKPLNELYKDKGGESAYYMDVGSIISDVLKKGIEEFYGDSQDDYFEEIKNDILDEVKIEKEVA